MQFMGIQIRNRRRSKRNRNSRRLRFEPLEDRHLLATFMVTNLDDAGPGSLRQAVLEANATAGADEIGFEAGLAGTIALTSGQIEVTEALTVTGPGTDKLTIDAQQNSRIFDASQQTMSLELIGLTLTGGNTALATNGADGGAIRMDGPHTSPFAKLTVRDSIITGNQSSGRGGAIHVRGYVEFMGGAVSDNSAVGQGGGIFSYSFGADEPLTKVTDSTVSGNSSENFGGGLASDSDILLENSSVSDNTASQGGGIYARLAMVANNSHISGNTAEDYGGGAYAGRLSLSNSTVTGNQAQSGAGIFAGRSDIQDSVISGNTATDFGGGIYSSEATIVRTTTTGNAAGIEGGGIYAHGNVTVRDSLISNNTNQGVSAQGDATIRDSTITDNVGEGVVAWRDVVISDSTISGNSADGVLSRFSSAAKTVRSTIQSNGGFGVRAELGGTVKVTESTISENGSGGVLAARRAEIIDSSILENHGRGVEVTDYFGSAISVTGSTISGNTSMGAGGGVYGGQQITITDSTIAENHADGCGGGVSASDATRSLTINRSTIADNMARCGGGIAGHDRVDITITASTISGNEASEDGGGIYQARDLSIVNSTISGNGSPQGRGGGIFEGRNLSVLNSTITENYAMSSGGGIFAVEADQLVIRSSIAAKNRIQDILLCSGGRCSTYVFNESDIAAPDNNIVVTNSLIGSNWGTTLTPSPLGAADADGNFIGGALSQGQPTVDPELGPLADNGGPTMTHMPRSTSPAIDTGANPVNLATDQRGVEREFNAGIDMGAVERRETILVVNSTGDGGDANPGDGICDDGAGNCTLRAAIEEADALPNGDFPDRIEFAIPGEGPPTIQPQSPLPAITDPVVIDGLTQHLEGEPFVELDGSAAGDGASGLTIRRQGGGSTVRGLIINRFDAHGIFISRSDGNTVEKNLIGTDPTGTVALGNGDAGVMIINGAENVVGGSLTAGRGNVVSANRRGVVIAGRLASGNEVFGNLIGVDASGVVALGNRGAGVEISGAPNNHVGASVAVVDGINVISGNRTGVEIRSSTATGNTLALNKMGTDLSATVGLPNRVGVSIRNGAAGNMVLGNQVAGNSNDGVRIVRSDGNRIDGNWIGAEGLGNGGDGVDIRGGQRNAVGGNLAAANGDVSANLDLAQGNRIRANGGYGVMVFGDDNLIQLNTIGTGSQDAEGNQRGGVQILKGSHNLVRSNSIFGNDGPGVLINGSAATSNRIQGNNIGVETLHGAGTNPALGNLVGIEIRGAHDNLIGGTTVADRNLVSQNDRYGIHIHRGASGNRIEGNEIGVVSEIIGIGVPNNVISTSADNGLGLQLAPEIIPGHPVSFRLVAVPNGRDGIFVESDGNFIGGTAQGAGNRIAGNSRNGVLLMGDGNRVEGNQIGSVATGVFMTANGADGVRVRGSNNTVGGGEASAANVIAYNVGSGVRISSGTGNVISQNSIFNNGGLGIDLGRTGPTPNDGPLDADRGANNLQNTPEILTTRRSDTHLQIIFRIPSQSPHSTFPIRAEFFVADDDGQEGRTFLAATEVMLPTPTVISIPLADLPPGAQIVATATDAQGNTSEFSTPFPAEQPAATRIDDVAADLVFQELGS